MMGAQNSTPVDYKGGSPPIVTTDKTISETAKPSNKLEKSPDKENTLPDLKDTKICNGTKTDKFEESVLNINSLDSIDLDVSNDLLEPISTDEEDALLKGDEQKEKINDNNIDEISLKSTDLMDVTSDMNGAKIDNDNVDENSKNVAVKNNGATEENQISVVIDSSNESNFNEEQENCILNDNNDTNEAEESISSGIEDIFNEKCTEAIQKKDNTVTDIEKVDDKTGDVSLDEISDDELIILQPNNTSRLQELKVGYCKEVSVEKELVVAEAKQLDVNTEDKLKKMENMGEKVKEKEDNETEIKDSVEDATSEEKSVDAFNIWQSILGEDGNSDPVSPAVTKTKTNANGKETENDEPIVDIIPKSHEEVTKNTWKVAEIPKKPTSKEVLTNVEDISDDDDVVFIDDDENEVNSTEKLKEITYRVLTESNENNEKTSASSVQRSSVTETEEKNKKQTCEDKAVAAAEEDDDDDVVLIEDEDELVEKNEESAREAKEQEEQNFTGDNKSLDEKTEKCSIADDNENKNKEIKSNSTSISQEQILTTADAELEKLQTVDACTDASAGAKSVATDNTVTQQNLGIPMDVDEISNASSSDNLLKEGAAPLSLRENETEIIDDDDDTHEIDINGDNEVEGDADAESDVDVEIVENTFDTVLIEDAAETTNKTKLNDNCKQNEQDGDHDQQQDNEPPNKKLKLAREDKTTKEKEELAANNIALHKNITDSFSTTSIQQNVEKETAKDVNPTVTAIKRTLSTSSDGNKLEDLKNLQKNPLDENSFKKPKIEDLTKERSPSSSSSSSTTNANADTKDIAKVNETSESVIKSEDNERLKYQYLPTEIPIPLYPPPKFQKTENIKLDFFNRFGKSFDNMTKRDLELLISQKVAESIAYKSELAELRENIDLLETAVTKQQKSLSEISKQYRDLEMVHSRVVRDLEQKNATFVVPVKITRAVGLQVYIPNKKNSEAVQIGFPNVGVRSGTNVTSLQPNHIKSQQQQQQPKQQTQLEIHTTVSVTPQTGNPSQAQSQAQQQQQQKGRFMFPKHNLPTSAIISSSSPSSSSSASSTSSASPASPSVQSNANGPVRRGCMQKVTPQRPVAPHNATTISTVISGISSQSQNLYRSINANNKNIQISAISKQQQQQQQQQQQPQPGASRILNRNYSSPSLTQTTSSAGLREQNVARRSPIEKRGISLLQIQQQQQKHAAQHSNIPITTQIPMRQPMANNNNNNNNNGGYKISIASQVKNSSAHAGAQSSQQQQQQILRRSDNILGSQAAAAAMPQSVPSTELPNNFMTSLTHYGAGGTSVVSITPAKPKEKEFIDLTEEDDVITAPSTANTLNTNATATSSTGSVSATTALASRTTFSQSRSRTANPSTNINLNTVPYISGNRSVPSQLSRSSAQTQTQVQVNARTATQRSNAASTATKVRPGSNVSTVANITRVNLANQPIQSRSRYVHPAPLPITPTQPHHPSWKLPPQRPTIHINHVENGIVISWDMENVAKRDNHTECQTYQIYAYQETDGPPLTESWCHVGDVKAMLLPMAVTLTQFQEGQRYFFAVRAVDIHNRLGPFSVPRTSN